MIKKILLKIENYFIFLFDKYFKIYIKPYLMVSSFDKFFDERFEYIFSDNFNKELNMRLKNLKVSDNEILDCIKEAECKIRSGNGITKLEYACNFFVSKNEDLILDMARNLVRDRVQSVFVKNEKEINAMIIKENICL